MRFKIVYGDFGGLCCTIGNMLYRDLFRKLEIVEDGELYDHEIVLEQADDAFRAYLDYYPFEPLEHDEFIRLVNMTTSSDPNSSQLGIDLLYGSAKPEGPLDLQGLMDKYVRWPHSYDANESELLRHKLLFIIRRLAL